MPPVSGAVPAYQFTAFSAPQRLSGRASAGATGIFCILPPQRARARAMREVLPAIGYEKLTKPHIADN
jgi:hypothetical protein